MSTSVEEVDEQVLEMTQSTTTVSSSNSSSGVNTTNNIHSRAQKSYKNLHEFSGE